MANIGAELRDSGIKLAVDHANQVHEEWSDLALCALKQFLRGHRGQFMTEQVRHYAYAIGVPVPPSLRAWGGVIVCAVKQGLIKQVGFAKVSNPKAHQANAALWIAA